MPKSLPQPEEEVEVEFSGENYILHFGMLAWSWYQRVSGHSILAEPLTERHLSDTERCMQLLWAGLREHHPELSYEDLLRRVTLREMDRLMAALRKAIEATAPIPSKEESELKADPRIAQS